MILLCLEEKEKKYEIHGTYFYKNEDLFSVSFVSGMKMMALSSVLADTCSYCVVLLPAALQWVTVNFLEKILSEVACWHVLEALSSFKCSRHGYIAAKIAKS